MYNSLSSLRHLAVIASFLSICSECRAQATDPIAAYKAFKEQAQQTYSSFRQQCINDYADFVRKAWDAFEGKAPIPKPKDETVPPVVLPKEDKQKSAPEPKPVVIEEVVEPAPVQPQPEPIEPIKEILQPLETSTDFVFYGTKAKVRYDTAKNFALRSVNGNDVADAFLTLADGRCENTLYDCLKLRSERHLCDWAYLMMLKELSNSICGKGSNEAVLLMAYLYMQSGYKMRLAENDGRLYMMFASDYYLYDHVGYVIDGYSYFGMEALPYRLNICQAEYPKEHTMSLRVNEPQIFDNAQSEIRERRSRYPEAKVSVAVNKNWLDFCATYPTSMVDDNFMTRWAMYANTPMAKDVSSQLYPQVKSWISGKSQLEAVNIILNWVQTGFEYEYDDKVWGGDRAFFAEESLYYPYCDCEDRSILFTRLVRDLLGLKCILVYYPGHLASAVCFTEPVNGDYIQLNGRKYIVSDPTYIGASVGMTMPNMDNQAAKVILLE